MISKRSDNLFISYSHDDKKYEKRLVQHLSLLDHQDLIQIWDDQCIPHGEKIKDQIDTAMQEANIFLLLVSASYIASNFCYSVEAQYAMEQHYRRNTHVMPVILRPCDWERAFFGHLKAVPTDGKAVTEYRNHDEGFREVAIAVRQIVENQTLSDQVPDIRPAATRTPSFPGGGGGLGKGGGLGGGGRWAGVRGGVGGTRAGR